ncbi:MAG: M48 family metallopeptidase [Lentisphaerae bacterium]|nr:M48 family metallopeptidase [Lentisphaerota bacterium]
MLSQNRISDNPEYNIALKRVGANLAKAANKPDYKWEFLVFENTEPNAFCLPGGKVGVYSGLFQYTSNDAELSSVVGHEIGHAIARHVGERMSQSAVQEIGAQAVATTLNGKSAGTVQAAMVAYSAGTNLGVMLPYSRTHEYEADKLGMVFMSKAGYNPNAAISFWMKAYLPTAMGMYNTAPNKKNLGEPLK